MKQQQIVLAFRSVPARSFSKGQLTANITIMCMIVAILLSPLNAQASLNCRGHFVNPLTDICWSCVMPISIGGVAIGKGKAPKKRDTRNPSSPVCMCTRNNIPTPGITVGFWEPSRMVDVTRVPGCMVNLGGIDLFQDRTKISDPSKGHSRSGTGSSFYHVHYYIFPLIYWLELLTDFVCLEMGSFDVAYLSEFDISWNDPKMQNLLNPESILFGNILAQTTCAADCAAASFSLPIDNMFWCAGCLGNMYPLSGANADHSGGIQASSLLVVRILNKMHRVGLARKTSTSSAAINGELCDKPFAPRLKKSQYKLQLVNPVTSSRDLGCWPLGLTDTAYSSGKEYPYDGEDFGYLIWRKKNCCLF